MEESQSPSMLHGDRVLEPGQGEPTGVISEGPERPTAPLDGSHHWLITIKLCA